MGSLLYLRSNYLPTFKISCVDVLSFSSYSNVFLSNWITFDVYYSLPQFHSYPTVFTMPVKDYIYPVGKLYSPYVIFNCTPNFRTVTCTRGLLALRNLAPWIYAPVTRPHGTVYPHFQGNLLDPVHKRHFLPMHFSKNYSDTLVRIQTHARSVIEWASPDNRTQG